MSLSRRAVWAEKFNRLHRCLRVQLTELRQARRQAVPYQTRFTVSDTSTSEGPQLSEFPGLIFLQYVDNQLGETEVTAYWHSREAATSSATALGRILHAGSPIIEGYVRRVRGRNERWWKRVALGQFILYAASFFGALVIIENYFARLLEAPNIVLEIPGREAVDILATDEINFDLGVLNRSRDVYSVVTLTVPSLERVDGREIEHRFWSNLTPPPIAPLSSSIVEVKGAPLSAGRYKLTVSSEAEAGYLRDSKSFSTSRMLRVWNLEPEGLIESIYPEDPGRAWLQGEVLVGLEAPNGLNCQVTVEKAPSVTFGPVDFPGVRTWSDLPFASTPSLEVRSRIFQAHTRFEGLRAVPFQILLETSTKIDWKTIQKTSSVACERISGKEESQP